MNTSSSEGRMPELITSKPASCSLRVTPEGRPRSRSGETVAEDGPPVPAPRDFRGLPGRARPGSPRPSSKPAEGIGGSIARTSAGGAASKPRPRSIRPCSQPRSHPSKPFVTISHSCGARRDRLRRWAHEERIRGWWINAQERPSFCFMPPESLPASRSLKGPRLEN